MSPKQHVQIEGRDLVFSNPGKIFFPDSGFTKGEVVAFYAAIAEAILPHLRNRPLTLKRYPDGIAGEHFYEKNAPKHTPPWVKTFAVPRSEGGSDINYILCNDKATLLWATNLGDIEKHVLLAQAPELNRPSAVVFDLDPGEPADILDCARVALHLKGIFDGLKLESFVKVSGSKGLHLSVPLNSAVTYEMTQPFAKAIAELAEQQLPKEVVSAMAKTLRRGKVLIDWSQNSDFKTTVCVYAMRGKGSGPFISMPVSWEELAGAVKRRKADRLFFDPPAAVKRIKRLGDLFAPVLEFRQTLPEAFTKALAAGPPPKLSAWPRNRKTAGAGTRDHSLREYAAKRDYTRTPEPPAREGAKTEGKSVHRFVIQKHDASHLHYDWRLEMQGVLRSWAVPKGPPTTPREGRLAMHVEDHPLEYADFEGIIPPGNYGAGTVMVWDQGEYEDLTGNPTAAFYAGKMHIVMRGKKLKGEWILVKDRREEESTKWLLIKAGEPIMISRKADDRSAVTGRSMAQIAKDKDREWQSNRPAKEESGKPRPAGRRAPPPPATAVGKAAAERGEETAPAFVEPMQCEAVAALPPEGVWSFEIKLDGYRCLAVKNSRGVTLFSRNKKSLNKRFPEVVTALEGAEGEFTADGEIVALDEEGRPSFQLLQNFGSKAPPILYYLFDLVHDGGEFLGGLPLETRRARLETRFSPADPLRISPLLQASAGEILDAVRRLGLEGVVGKRSGSLYEPGKRSGAWIKHRINREQEFVIGGYVPGTHGFDSLLVGVHEEDGLRFVAKVKNGFLPRDRTELFPQLKKLETASCPFFNLPEKKGSRWGESLTAEKMRECRWVKPRRVCQVAFVEWTDAGHLRHCTFAGWRDDKRSTEVVREEAAASQPANAPATSRSSGRSTTKPAGRRSLPKKKRSKGLPGA